MIRVAEIEWKKCSTNGAPHAVICDTLVAHNWQGFICLQMLEGDGSADEAQHLSDQVRETLIGVSTVVANHTRCSLSRSPENSSRAPSYCIEVNKYQLQSLIDQIEKDNK